MKEKEVPQRLYLHKHFMLNNKKVIDCRSIYAERQSESDIEYIINK